MVAIELQLLLGVKMEAQAIGFLVELILMLLPE
jgi:hypothetical protein